MSLSEFVRGHHEEIIREFAAYAGTLMPAGTVMSNLELRDHADEILTAIVEDIQLRQTGHEQHRKSQGLGSARTMETSGKRHASDRIAHGYPFMAVLAEFRALRASVLRLYDEAGGTELADVRRFNEAVDEALTESMREFAELARDREAFILQLSDALRPLDDTAAVKMTATRLLGAQLHVNRVFYADARDGYWHASKGYETGVCTLPDLPFAMVTYGDRIVEILTGGRRLVVSDIETDVRFSPKEREAHLDLEVRAEVAAPLVKNGKLLAMLVAQSAMPREWTPMEIALLEETAERTWAAVDRARAEAAVSESEGRLRLLNEELEGRVAARTSEVRKLFTRLVSVQEEERRRIARDIHDHIGQQMTALRMHLVTLRTHAFGQVPLVEQAERTERLAEELDQSIDVLTWQLRPAALDHLGLPAALRNLVTGWAERFAVPADFVEGATDLRSSPDVEANLYRIAQEALHNVAKHADATQASVYLTRQEDDLVLSVEDNGRGFAPDAHRPIGEGSGMGLLGMRERAALVGGKLDINSGAGRGTSIRVSVPRSGMGA